MTINGFCVNVRAVKTGRSNLTGSTKVRGGETNTTQRLMMVYWHSAYGLVWLLIVCIGAYLIQVIQHVYLGALPIEESGVSCTHVQRDEQHVQGGGLVRAGDGLALQLQFAEGGSNGRHPGWGRRSCPAAAPAERCPACL